MTALDTLDREAVGCQNLGEAVTGSGRLARPARHADESHGRVNQALQFLQFRKGDISRNRRFVHGNPAHCKPAH